MTVSGANYGKYLSILSAHYNPVAFMKYMIDIISLLYQIQMMATDHLSVDSTTTASCLWM